MAPVDDFVDGLSRLGLVAETQAGLLVVTITPLAGNRAGAAVEVGVAAEELVSWPLVTPHWVHLPDGLDLPGSNRQPSDQLPGWSRYSRPLKARADTCASPARAWLAHVRTLLGELA